LKDESIESNKLWKAAKKPRHDPVFDKRQSCRLRYRKRIKESEKSSLSSYTNGLHDALMQKMGLGFGNAGFLNSKPVRSVMRLVIAFEL
jgi:hypothetical protein